MLREKSEVTAVHSYEEDGKEQSCFKADRKRIYTYYHADGKQHESIRQKCTKDRYEKYKYLLAEKF